MSGPEFPHRVHHQISGSPSEVSDNLAYLARRVAASIDVLRAAALSPQEMEPTSLYMAAEAANQDAQDLAALAEHWRTLNARRGDR